MSPNGDRQHFEEARAAITEAGRTAEDARISLFESTERVRREQFAKGKASPDAENLARDKRTAAREALSAFDAQREIFFPYTDPRTNAGMLSDRTPIVLFPVRMETRFGYVDTGAGAPMPQLWVRVYPDDCVVDSFEPLPSENEIASGRTRKSTVMS